MNTGKKIFMLALVAIAGYATYSFARLTSTQVKGIKAQVANYVKKEDANVAGLDAILKQLKGTKQAFLIKGLKDQFTLAQTKNQAVKSLDLVEQTLAKSNLSDADKADIKAKLEGVETKLTKLSEESDQYSKQVNEYKDFLYHLNGVLYDGVHGFGSGVGEYVQNETMAKAVSLLYVQFVQLLVAQFPDLNDQEIGDLLGIQTADVTSMKDATDEEISNIKKNK